MGWLIAISIFSLALFLGGILAFAVDFKKKKPWHELLGLQGLCVGAALLLTTRDNTHFYLPFGLFLLLEAVFLLASADIIKNSKLAHKSTLEVAAYTGSILCAIGLYAVIFTFPTSLEGVSHLLLLSTGLGALAALGLVIECFMERKGFMKALIISLVTFIGIASFISAIANTPLRTFASWVLLLESVFLLGHVVRKVFSKSRVQALAGLIALVISTTLLVTLLIKSPHDPLFNFLPTEKYKNGKAPLSPPWL